MISKSLSTSEKFANLGKQAGRLAEFCQALYPLIVAHADDFGKLPGDPFTVKFSCHPTSPRSLEHFQDALLRLHEVGLIVWYQVDGKPYLQVTQYERHQEGLHKRTKSKFPDVPGDSGNFPEIPGQLKGREEKGREEKRTVLEPPPQKPEPDSRVKVFVDWFHDEYAKRRDGAKYVVKGAKDGQLVKTLLQTHDLERLKKHAVILLTSNEEWIETTDRGIGILAAKINWLEDRLTAWEKKHG
jgi:hypothetical protein